LPITNAPQRRKGARTRWVIAICVCALVSSTTVSVSTADDMGSVAAELAKATDFRVRVSAALALGQSRHPRAPGALVKALDDGHPAVRAAAAAAIAALGQLDKKSALAALPILRQRVARERAPSVRTQMGATIQTLEALEADQAAADKPRAPKVLVKLGHLQNMTGVRGTQLSAVFRGATRTHAGALPGVEVLGETTEAAGEITTRRLPQLVLDGVVMRLVRASEGERVTVSAEVEYVFRKMPEHALRGSIKGAAKAQGSSGALADRVRVAVLEDQALQGAVESAMRGAPEAMLQALR